MAGARAHACGLLLPVRIDVIPEGVALGLEAAVAAYDRKPVPFGGSRLEERKQVGKCLLDDLLEAVGVGLGDGHKALGRAVLLQPVELVEGHVDVAAGHDVDAVGVGGGGRGGGGGGSGGRDRGRILGGGRLRGRVVRGGGASHQLVGDTRLALAGDKQQGKQEGSGDEQPASRHSPEDSAGHGDR